MKEFETKYRTVLDVAKIVFSDMPELIFCGGTALNTFYLDYRYSEDLDIGYRGTNPKSSIEILLQQKGYSVSRTNMKIRDVIGVGNVEVKMDVFEYEPIIGLRNVSLEGVNINVPTLEEFLISKMISFLTRENISGITRDAYDLYELGKVHGKPIEFVKKYKSEIKKRIVSVPHNFEVFRENRIEAISTVAYLLKKPIEYYKVLDFMIEVENILVKK